MTLGDRLALASTHSFTSIFSNCRIKIRNAVFPSLLAKEHFHFNVFGRRERLSKYKLFISKNFAEIVNDVQAMRVSEIKKELNNLGIKHDDCFEKEELVNRLAKAKERKQSCNEEAQESIDSKHASGVKNFENNSKGLVCTLPLRKIKSSPREPREYILIELSFGDKGRFEFVLDTGSSATLVRKEFVCSDLSIPEHYGKFSRGMGGMGHSGNQGKQFDLPDVAFGDYKLPNFQVVAMDLGYTGLDASVVGILGLNFFNHFDVDFDFFNDKISFFESGSAASGFIQLEAMARLKPAKVFYGLPAFEVAINNGKEVTAILDMGSSLSLINTSTAISSGIFINSNQGKDINSAYVMGIDGNKLSISGSLVDVHFVTKNFGSNFEGKITFQNVPVTIGDLQALDLLNASMIVGLDLLRFTRLVISFHSGTIFFQRTNIP